MTSHTLREAFVDLADKAQSAPFDLMLLYDASGSISNADFASALSAGLSLLTVVWAADTRAAFGQFADQWRLECNLTSDINQILTAHTNTRRLSGGTNTAAALASGAVSVLRSSRVAAIKIVVLFTDGAPNDQNEAIRAAIDVRALGATIIGVGIGNVQHAQLAEVCGGPSNAFVLQNWQELLSAMPTEANRRSRHVPGSDIEMTFEQLNLPIGLRRKDPLQLRVTIFNRGDAPVRKGSRIEIEAGDCYRGGLHILEREIAVNDETEVEMTLKATGGASIATLPQHFIAKVIAPMTKLPYQAKKNAFHVALPNFVADIKEWQPPADTTARRANLLVFGSSGVGKSTLINHFKSAFEHDFVKVANAYKSSDHVTDSHSLYELCERVACIDTVGLNITTNNYGQEQLEHIVDGMLEFGFKLNDEKNVAKAAIKGMATKHERECHAAVVVITCQFVAADETEKARLREYIQYLCKRDLNPIVAVTHTDTIRDPNQLKALPATMSQITSLSERDIFPVDNSETADSLDQRKQILRMLDRLLQNAEMNMKKNAAAAARAPIGGVGGSAGRAATAALRAATAAGAAANGSLDRFVVEAADGSSLGDVYLDDGDENLTSDSPVSYVRALIKSNEVEGLQDDNYAFVTNDTKAKVARRNENGRVKLQHIIIKPHPPHGLPSVRVDTTAPPYQLIMPTKTP